KLVTSEGGRGRDVTLGIDMDAVGDESQAMFTLEFAPNLLGIDDAIFPSANPDVILGADAPAGTTLAVNAALAGEGRITVMLNFNGPVPSGPNKRIVNFRFHVARLGSRVWGIRTVTIPDISSARQIV